MDIWDWVTTLQSDLREAGQGRVADLIDSIPDDTFNSRPERVLAALPEAIAAARTLKNPWLEVFFRHWGLNNRLSNLAEGEVALPEAVSLIEFAHREGHVECPQSVCVTQDIAICYGNIDGPGWAPDILAVCEETLARITPAWPCFTCISREYAEALLHAERGTEAVGFLAKQAQAILDEGDTLDFAFQALQARALWKSGDADRALALLEEIDRLEEEDGGGDPDRLQQRAILRATIQAERGEPEAAAESLPAWSGLVPNAYGGWAQAACLLARAQPERNTWQLGRLLQMSLAHFSRVGAHHDAVTVATRHADLALRRGATWTARRALAIAQAHLLKLRLRDPLAPVVAELDARLRDMPQQPALPVPAAELAAHLGAQEGGDPEKDVEWLLAACTQRPDDPELAEFAANALVACGTVDEAHDHLWRFVEAHPLQDAPIQRLMALLLERGASDELTRLGQLVAPANPQAARWVQAQSAWRQKRWAEAAAHLSDYVQAAPQAFGALRLWASAALNDGDLATALRLRQDLVAAQDAPSDDHWDLLTVASASQDWALVRQLSAFLGLTLQSESGPVEEAWGVAYLRCEQDGEVRDVYARRTGPVTARVLVPDYAPHPQRLEDWIAFDAALVEPPPEDEAERAHFVPTFRAMHTLQPGGFGDSCFVDGAAPGEALFTRLREALAQRGWHCWVSSDDDYQVTDPGTGTPIPGLHFSVTAPQGVSARAVDQALRELTAAWPHPVCWPRFADRAGLDLAAHLEVVERYGL
jgi:tetratricopeptide (TPR) repeat protein